MGNHYLLVDDARRAYFDCEKFLLVGGETDGALDALHEQPFEQWLEVANWREPPPEKTNRFLLALPEAKAVYAFLKASHWKARIVSLYDDDFRDIYEPWTRSSQERYRKVGGLLI